MIQDPSRLIGNIKRKLRSDEADDTANNPHSLIHKGQTSIASGAVETATTSITNGRRTQSQAAASSLGAAGDSQKSFSHSEKIKRSGSDPGDQVADGKAGDQTPTKKARKSTSKATHSETWQSNLSDVPPRSTRGRKRLDRGGKTATRRRSGAPVVEEDEDGDTEG